MSILPREAAITAALAGAVVVVLAYASGFGLRTPLVAAPVTPSVPARTAAPQVPAAVPVPVQPAAVVRAPVVAVAPRPVPTSAPSVPPAPRPVPTPVVPTPQACPPGLVEGLLAPVGQLVGGLLGTDVLGAPTHLLDCTLGPLLGSTCCGTVPARTVAP